MKRQLVTDERGFIISREARKFALTAEVRESLKPVDFMSYAEVEAIPVGSMFVFDLECYHNFFYVAFKCLSNGRYIAFEQSPDCTLDIDRLRLMLWRYCIVSFSGRNYDIPMIELALTGASCAQLKEASDFIIKSPNRITSFAFERAYSLNIPRYNHIDLVEVAPLQGSLKLYAGRMHCQRMQDLPIHADSILTANDAEVIRRYCCNDLNNTELLYRELESELQLRKEMSKQYKVDLRSKSDAQVAEAVINKELEKILGKYPSKPSLSEGLVLKYDVPSFVIFQTEQLQNILQTICNTRFHLDGYGSPIMPEQLEKLTVKIGNAIYKLGIGGLHSTEKCVAHIASDEIILADNDVESFYPRTILNQRLYPPHLGEAFLTVYESLVAQRIEAKANAKKAKDFVEAKRWKVIADSQKITVNGSFGKLGNKYSTLYAPQLMLQVTITGQLVLLMLIEALELVGIEVVSGNTDGFIAKYHKSRHNDVRRLIAAWEAHTGYKTEETRYQAVYSRDVNSYLAIKNTVDPNARFLDERLGIKTKGAYSERGSALNSVLSRNPETLVCIDAVLQYVSYNKSVEETIRACTDFRRFVSVRKVKGGAEKNGKYLGKIVRWYYPRNEAGYIAYVETGNKVAKTDGARPVMDLPATFPNDIDYSWYIREANEMLYECAALQQAKTGQLFK